MKVLSMVLFFIFSLFTGTLTNAQSSKNVCTPPPPIGNLEEVVGDWEGSYTYKGETYDFKMTFSMEGEKLVATSSLATFNIDKGTFKTRVCASNELHISHMTLINHYIEFIGRPKDGKMEGKFRYREDLKQCVKAKEKFSLGKVDAPSSKV